MVKTPRLRKSHKSAAEENEDIARTNLNQLGRVMSSYLDDRLRTPAVISPLTKALGTIIKNYVVV
jgi:hypothetical protein